MLKLDEVEEGINGIRGVNYVRYITVERKEVERERTRRKRQSEGPPPISILIGKGAPGWDDCNAVPVSRAGLEPVLRTS